MCGPKLGSDKPTVKDLRGQLGRFVYRILRGQVQETDSPQKRILSKALSLVIAPPKPGKDREEREMS